MVKEIICPVCGSIVENELFSSKDFTVSNKTFAIAECTHCSVRVTVDAPDVHLIAGYYRAENYISHTETKKGLINRLYHLARFYTLNFKRRVTEKESGIKKGSILDIGCGTGSFLHEMKSAGWEITGLEPDEKARARGEDLYKIKSLPAEKLFELENGRFNVITMWHVLEHVHDLNGYLRKIYALLKPGGLLLIAVPNYTSYDAGFYKNNWAAYDVPRHLYHFSPRSMDQLLSQHGFLNMHIRPLWLDSYYISMLSEKYMKSRLGIIRAVVIASISNLGAVLDRKKCSSLVYAYSK